MSEDKSSKCVTRMKSLKSLQSPKKVSIEHTEKWTGWLFYFLNTEAHLKVHPVQNYGGTDE